MPDLDKWRKREAEQYATDNDVTYEEAVAELFPDEPTKAPADEPDEPVAEDEQQAPADAPKAPAAKGARGTVGSKG